MYIHGDYPSDTEDELENTDNIINDEQKRNVCYNCNEIEYKYIFIGWITFGIYAIIFYVVFIIQNKEPMLPNAGYILCSILSILIGLYSILSVKRIFKTYQITHHILNLYKLKHFKAMEYKQDPMNRHNVLAKLTQILEEKSHKNIELKNQLRWFKKWNKQITDNRTSSNMSPRQIKLIRKRRDSEAFESIKHYLLKRIKRKELEICQIEKNILFKKIYNIMANRRERNKGYINIIDFDEYIKLWPYRYRDQFRNSGKTFVNFMDISGDIVNNNKLSKFIDKIVADEVKNGVILPGIY